jgi:hypothetical protein
VETERTGTERTGTVSGPYEEPFDPLIGSAREHVQRMVDKLIRDDKAFICGICHNLVDARFTREHADSHDRESR